MARTEAQKRYEKTNKQIVFRFPKTETYADIIKFWEECPNKRQTFVEMTRMWVNEKNGQ